MTRKSHCHSKYLPLLLLMLALTGRNASGQLVEKADFLLDSQNRPAVSSGESNNQGFYNGPVIPTAAMTTPARVLNKVNRIRNGKQIRVSIQFLMVDPETRAAIYETLDSSKIKTSRSGTATAQPVATLDGLQSEIRCSETISTPSRVTTAVLDEAESAAILDAIAQSSQSNVTAAPSVVMFDGQTAEVHNTVQQPFVTGFERVELDGEPHAKSNIQVYSEGATVRMKTLTLASSSGTVDRIHLATELISKSIVDVKTELVYGIKDKSVSVQTPLQQIKSVVAAEELALSQTLLIDPYVTKQIETKVDSGVPILSKIPYVARSFKNVAIAIQDQQMLVLLQPSIELDSDDHAQNVNTALTQ